MKSIKEFIEERVELPKRFKFIAEEYPDFEKDFREVIKQSQISLIKKIVEDMTDIDCTCDAGYCDRCEYLSNLYTISSKLLELTDGK